MTVPSCEENIVVDLSSSFEDEMYKEWIATVDEVAKVNLEKPLLLRADTGLQLTVNFDPQVCQKH